MPGLVVEQSMQAKAIVFPEVGKVEICTVTLPPMADDCVLVELETSAISVGTERWALLSKRPPGRFPGVVSSAVSFESPQLAEPSDSRRLFSVRPLAQSRRPDDAVDLAGRC